MVMIRAIRYLTVCTVIVQAASAVALEPDVQSQEPLARDSATRQMLLQVPLSFEANQGQADRSVKFLSRGDGYALFLTSQDAVFQLASGAVAKSAPSVLRMRLLGARDGGEVSGAQKLTGTVNYFVGNDRAKWHTGVPTFAKVYYRGIYSGVDAVFYGNQRHLEYDFTVAPGADTRQITMEFSGARPKLDRTGNVLLSLAGETVTLHKPVLYQGEGSSKRSVDGSYLVAGNRVQVRVGRYDHRQPLVIDPVISYLTYLGGSTGIHGNPAVTSISCRPNACPPGFSPQRGQGIAVDGSGNVYVTGQTWTTNFPTKNPIQATASTSTYQWNAYVTKLNPAGTGLVYSTYLGGSVNDEADAIAVDAKGSAYVVGFTFSGDFPTTPGSYVSQCPVQAPGPPVLTYCQSSGASFLTKLSADGQSLAYSTYLVTPTSGTPIRSVAVDSQGRAYVAGDYTAYGNSASSSTPSGLFFPTTSNALLPSSIVDQAQHPGTSSPGMAFLTVFSADGSSLVYSTLFGDTEPWVHDNVDAGFTRAAGVAVDPAGNFYLACWTADPFIPVTPNAFQTTYVAYTTASRSCVAKFSSVDSANGPQLLYSTYLGAMNANLNASDQIAGIVADANGSAYVTGYTQNPGFPTTPGAYDPGPCGVQNGGVCGNGGFLTKFTPDGSALAWSTLVGYSSNVVGHQTISAILPPRLDAWGNVYVQVQSSRGYPEVNPVQTFTDLNSKVGITKFDPTGSKVLFSTLLGSPTGQSQYGASTQFPAGLDVDPQGNIYVAGMTNGGDLPTTPGAFQTAFPVGSQNYGAFIAKISGPVTDFSIPWFTEYPGYVSRFVFLNTGTSPATYQINVTPETGNTVLVNPNYASGTISPRSQLVVNASDLVPSITLKPRAAAQITTGGTDLNVYGIYNLVQPSTGSITNTSLLPNMDFSSTGSVLEAPFFTTASNYSGDFVFSNGSQKTVTGTVTLLSTVGNAVFPSQTSFQIPPASEFDLPASSLVSGYAQAGGPSVAAALFSFNAPEGYVKGIYKIVSVATGAVGTSELVSPQSASSSPTVLIAPWFTTYPGYNSTFYLTNRGSQAATVAISVLTEQGNSANLGTTSLTLPANSQLAIPAATVVSSFTGNTRGSAIFTISGPTNNIEGLYQVTNLSTGAMSNTPMSRPSGYTGSTPFVVPWFTTFPGYVSRFVFVNRSSQAAPFSVQILPEANNTATLNVTSGVIPAQSMYVLNASSVVSGFSAATRAGAVFQVSSPDANIDALYNVVNPGSGVISNTRLTH